MSYYGRPVIKRPVWNDYVAGYLFTGGLAGASSLLAAGARFTGRPGLARVARRVGLGGLVASPALLIADLGRPGRFANMLRVARPTSPMSMGAWLLSVYGPVAGAATVCDTLGVLPGVTAAADATAGMLGSVVTTYTGVLLADTAVPVWHEAGRDLPLLFAASAATSAGAAAALLASPEESGPARRLALAGLVAEQAAMGRMERRLGPEAAAYRRGGAGRYARAARWLGRAGAVALLAGGDGRRKIAHRRMSLAGAGLLLASAAATRFAVFKAGFQSADGESRVDHRLSWVADGSASAVRGGAVE
jgi:formate-dependent nitrite reductase membrane component NrfD